MSLLNRSVHRMFSLYKLSIAQKQPIVVHDSTDGVQLTAIDTKRIAGGIETDLEALKV